MSKSTSRPIVTPAMPGEIVALADSGPFAGTTSLALAGRIMLAKHAHKLYDHLPGVLSGDDPHDIHQMRVATRRLRASLQSTAIAYRPNVVGKLRKRLQVLARALGAVRDLDVMLIRLRQDAEGYPEHERSELDAAIERLQAERDTAHTALVAELRRKRTARLLHTLNDFLLCPLEDIQAKGDGLPLLVRHHAGGAIWREYEAVLHFETAMPRASSERLHELRIACKHLRYTLELFEPALDTRAKDLIKLVETMQEHLGDIHDADVALVYFAADDQTLHGADQAAAAATDFTVELAPGADQGSFVAPQGASEPAQARHNRRYADLRRTERAQLLEALGPLWQQLSGKETRRKLAKAMVAL